MGLASSTFCVFVPEEIIWAANGIIVGLCAGAKAGGGRAGHSAPWDGYSRRKQQQFRARHYLRKNGVRVYLYPGMTHVKALIVDGWAGLGSANFNHLSLRLNQEVNVATSDAATVGRLRRELFEVDFDKSHELREAIPVGWTDHLVEELMNWF